VSDGAMRRRGGASVSCPSDTARSDRGAVAQRPLFDDTPRCTRSLEALHPGCPDYASVQRRAGSKNDARAHSAHGLVRSGPHPGPSLDFATTSCSSQFALPQSLLRELLQLKQRPGSEAIPRRPSPPASMCLNTHTSAASPTQAGFYSHHSM
jgi:hypothetical protein